MTPAVARFIKVRTNVPKVRDEHIILSRLISCVILCDSALLVDQTLMKVLFVILETLERGRVMRATIISPGLRTYPPRKVEQCQVE